MVVTLDRQDFLSFCRPNPGSLLKLIEVVCEQLRRTDYILAELPCCNCRQGWPRRFYALLGKSALRWASAYQRFG
jgi:hypothetical protein